MVSLRMMGWGLVLLENSSVVAAVTAAQWLLQQWLWGVNPKKVGFSIKNIGYGHFFKDVFSENTLYTFSRFCQFPKGGHFNKISTRN